MIAALIAAVVVGTWNGNWFPSGRAEHRANEDVERATIRAAGAMLRAGIDRLDPLATNDIVLCVNEVRGPRVARALAEAVGRTNLAVAVVTGYRRRDRYDMQQDVILTTLPVASATWSVWKSKDKVKPPRGYARADLVFAPAVTAAVVAVHFKSNYGATDDAKKADNRLKRTLAAEQLAALLKPARKTAAIPALIAGDFNADPWRNEFAGETLFVTLSDAGFANTLASLPAKDRGTHPNRKWGDSCLDYILVRGLAAGTTVLGDALELSDHRPVFVLVTP